jgi:hypothetical protein
MAEAGGNDFMGAIADAVLSKGNMTSTTSSHRI